MMRGLRAEVIDNSPIGYFRAYVDYGGSRVEITRLRGIPIEIGTLDSQDPFGDSAASINFPQITIFDRLGEGELWWLRPYANIDIEWQNVEGADYHWEWEGFIVSVAMSFGSNNSGVQVECKGALYQADNYLAAPSFPPRPIPYELLIKDGLNPQKHVGLRTQPLHIEWPNDWEIKVPSFNRANYLNYLKPWGVKEGQRWTAMTTRQTGSWDPTLTGFIQGLLSIMWAPGGRQWTIRKDRGRKPILYLRQQQSFANPNLLVVQLGDPGVEISVTKDFTQSANVLFGQGSDHAGVTFTGMQVSQDGQHTSYRPFAFSPYVYPTDPNPNQYEAVIRKEAQIPFPPGLDQIDAREVARFQLQRFADPGLTGTITLRTDPLTRNGKAFPRMLIKAGRSVLIQGFGGIPEGILAHITQAQVNIKEAVTTLTIDTKYRDQLTVSEVRARVFDALTPLRSLQVGKYSNTVQDLLKPWSYAEGSGVIPSGGGKNATEFFLNIMPNNAQFPWTDWTKRHPPKDPHSAKFYIRIPPADINDSRNNWAGKPEEWNMSKKDREEYQRKVRDGQDPNKRPYQIRRSYTVKAAQNFTIRLMQIAAYDKNGNVMPVRFHVSFFSARTGVTQDSMPRLPGDLEGIRILGQKNNTYKEHARTTTDAQPNPFFEGAWEQYRPDGTQVDKDGADYLVAPNSRHIIGFGNFYEPAGYYPGRATKGAKPTGKLVDETTWSWDTADDSKLDPYDRSENKDNTDAGKIYVMIYCDDHKRVAPGEPVFFLGRLFRQEPGTG